MRVLLEEISYNICYSYIIADDSEIQFDINNDYRKSDEMKSINNKSSYLDISFNPRWDYIPLTRKYLENFLMFNVQNKQIVAKIIIVASELLENAIKYSYADGVRTHIRKNKKNRKVELKVSNSTKKIDAERLINYINEINRYPDPFKFYLDRMKQSIIRNDGKTGLGLSRIKYEGNAMLSAKFFDREDGTGIVEIKAVFLL